MRHLSHKQSELARLNAAREEAHRSGDLEGYLEHSARLKEIEQLEERYECLICHNEEVRPGSGELLISAHGVKSAEPWHACKSCEAAIASPAEPHCVVCARSEGDCERRQDDKPHEQHRFVACTGEIEMRVRNVWHHECECRSNPGDINSRTLVICASCEIGLGVVNYINKR